MDPSIDLLQLSREEIAKQLQDKRYVGNVEVATSQSVSHLNIKNVGYFTTSSTTRQPSYGHAVKKEAGDATLESHSLEENAKQLEDNIQVGNARVQAIAQSAGQMNVGNVGIKTLQYSFAQAVAKKEKTDATQPLKSGPEEVANVELEEKIQVGSNVGVVTSQAAGQMYVANTRVATKLQSVKNVEIVASPSEKPGSAKDPPTSSIRCLDPIGTSQYEDEINARNQGELATSESKGASLEKNQEMKKSRNMKKKNLENGGEQVSSSLTEEFEKQLEGHNVNVGNAGLTTSQPASHMNVENLRVATLQSEVHVTKENAEITTSHSEKPGIMESEVENSPTSSSIRNLEAGTSLLSKNVYWTIAHLDERDAKNQGAATSESKVEPAHLEIKQKRKNPKKKKKKKMKKKGSGEGPSGVNVPSNKCCSKEIIAIFIITIAVLIKLVVAVSERSSSGAWRFESLWQILAAISVPLI